MNNMQQTDHELFNEMAIYTYLTQEQGLNADTAVDLMDQYTAVYEPAVTWENIDIQFWDRRNLPESNGVNFCFRGRFFTITPKAT